MDITFTMVARTSSARTRQTPQLVHHPVLPVEQVWLWAEHTNLQQAMIDNNERGQDESIRT